MVGNEIISSLGVNPTLKTKTSEIPNSEHQSKNSLSNNFHPFGNDGVSFKDIIDVVNPLHHVPVIGTLYRALTGDNIDALPKIAGSTLYFGPLGALLSGAGILIEETSGHDLSDHIVAKLNADGVIKTAPINNQPPSLGLINEIQPISRENNSDLRLFDGESRSDYITNSDVSAWARTELAYRKKLAAQSVKNFVTLGTLTEQRQITQRATTPQKAPSPALLNVNNPTAAEVSAAYKAGLSVTLDIKT